MTQFALWFAYYDSFFLAQQLKFNYEFYFHHVIHDSKWPVSTCPPLCAAYTHLQQFINAEQNWIISKCKQEELEIVQAHINELVLFLNLEKSYACSFWEKDYRRIEASTVHFYTFLQMLIKALIPYQSMTIFQCRTANKLCVKLEQLEKLMNQILKCINPIAKVLSSSKFAEESALIKNFFENWICFMKKLPNIKKNKLNHVHKLVKFVCLTNPIQICTVNKGLQYEQAIRKKSNTVGTNIQNNAHTYPNIELFKSNIAEQTQDDVQNGNIKRERKRKRSMSCASIVSKKMQDINLQNEDKIKIFKLPDFVLNYAVEQQNRNKKLTISSLSYLNRKQKPKSYSKFKTLTTNQSNTYSRQHPHDSNFSTSKKQRQKSRSSYHKRSVVTSSGKEPQKNSSLTMIRRMSNHKHATKYYQNEVERNEEIMSVRSSKQSTIRRREMSVMTINKKEDGTKITTNNLSYFGNNLKYSLKEGQLARSKWEILRMYVHERIRIRKLKKILQMD